MLGLVPHWIRIAPVFATLGMLAMAAGPCVAQPPSEGRDAGEFRIRFTLPKYALPAAERDLVASCLVLEAASQREAGMRAVMAVIRNRSRGLPELFAPTVLRQKQFSALNRLTAGRESVASVLARARRDELWPLAQNIVDAATLEDWHDPTYGATHYTLTGERTSWTSALARTTTIGSHAFYR